MRIVAWKVGRFKFDVFTFSAEYIILRSKMSKVKLKVTSLWPGLKCATVDAWRTTRSSHLANMLLVQNVTCQGLLCVVRRSKVKDQRSVPRVKCI